MPVPSTEVVLSPALRLDPTKTPSGVGLLESRDLNLPMDAEASLSGVVPRLAQESRSLAAIVLEEIISAWHVAWKIWYMH